MNFWYMFGGGEEGYQAIVDDSRHLFGLMLPRLFIYLKVVVLPTQVGNLNISLGARGNRVFFF